MSITLFEHNQKAYDSAAAMLRETGKAAVIHPTGTGKSFIGFKLCEDNPDKTVCWLSPSSYIFQTQIENLKKTGAEVPQNIKFFTYKKLSLMSDSEIAQIKAEVCVFDEYHRCGASTWQVGAERLIKAYPDAPILGLTATNIRYLDNQRDMAVEIFDGCIASELTLGAAIVKNIIPAPKYVMTVYSYQKDLEKYARKLSHTRNSGVRAEAEKCLDNLRRAIEKADGLDEIFNKHMENRTGKYIVFTQRADAMRECISHAGEWFAKVDKHPHIYAVRTTEPETSRQFGDFVNDNDTSHLRLLFCIDALNEGIHLDGIDGVILFRPTVSPIVYKQQIGRALSAGTSKTPVIFDIVNNIDNLYCVDSIKEEMRAAITYYNYLGEYRDSFTDSFEVVDEIADCRELFEKLDETLSVSWDIMYERARQYYLENGCLVFPREYTKKEGSTLPTWINTQRNIRAGKALGNLTEERIKKLDEIGMRWESVNDISWNRHFEAYKKYVEEGGNLRVPFDYATPDGVDIGRWLQMLRSYKSSGIRSSYFTAEREKALEEVGIIWDQIDFAWERNYQAALAYYKQHGDLEVPAGYIQDGVKLYNWLSDLRKKYRGRSKSGRGEITDIQIQRMNALGMRWITQKELLFEEGFEHAKRYSVENGAADAPFAYVSPDGYKLGLFLSKCREKYAKGKLSEEQTERLDSIGMVWDKSRKNDWETCFEYAKEYYQKHGGLNVPPDHTVNGVWLNKWLNEQKQIILGRRKGKSLTDEQIGKLESISFKIDTLNEQKWSEKYAELKRYYEDHGNIRIPSNDDNLYTWLSNQKQMYRSGKMLPKRIELFREVGLFN